MCMALSEIRNTFFFLAPTGAQGLKMCVSPSVRACGTLCSRANEGPKGDLKKGPKGDLKRGPKERA